VFSDDFDVLMSKIKKKTEKKYHFNAFSSEKYFKKLMVVLASNVL
jgi:hypothetical protein